MTINWGDDSSPTVVHLTDGERAFTAAHQYLDDDPSGTPQDIYTISATVTDDDGYTATQLVSIDVTAVVDIVDDSLTTDEDTPITVLASSLLGNDSFEGAAVVTAVGTASHGTVSLVGGNITYTPDVDFHGSDSFTIQVADGQGGTDTIQVDVTDNGNTGSGGGGRIAVYYDAGDVSGLTLQARGGDRYNPGGAGIGASVVGSFFMMLVVLVLSLPNIQNGQSPW